jgi:hypothetical protein
MPIAKSQLPIMGGNVLSAVTFMPHFGVNVQIAIRRRKAMITVDDVLDPKYSWSKTVVSNVQRALDMSRDKHPCKHIELMMDYGKYF